VTDPRVLAIRPDLDTVLESGDAIVMPKRPEFRVGTRRVSNPGALQFVATNRLNICGKPAAQSTADKGRIFVVLPNGSSEPVRGRGWGRQAKKYRAAPGSTIIVPSILVQTRPGA
jgi:hypothetical protein